MKLLGENIHAVNIGADIFADALKAQEIETQQLNWTCLLYTSPSPRDRG